MFLFKLCYDSIKNCYSSDNVDAVHERTPLHRGTVVHNPPPQRSGFSGGFVSFFESSRGILFGFTNLAIFYLAAVVAFSFIFEEWTIIDSVYFATVTFTTIGYGDITPTTDGGRLFTVVFGLYGIFILGFFAGIIGEKIVETHNAAVQAVEDRARQRFKRLFSVAEEENHEQQEDETERTAMGIICDLAQLQLPLISTILIFGILYGVLFEGWTVVESVYFASITASTVGYGDFSPQTQWSRLLCVLCLPLVVTVFCEALGRIAGAYLDYKMTLQEKRFLNRQLTLSDLDKMDTNRDGEVEWGEFVVFMLTAMQKVDEDDIKHLQDVFKKIDITGTGKLNKQDILGIIRKNTTKNPQVEA